ncbi:MAG: hypothetical protein AAF251_05820 [Pseudomonadota bacterium]
MNWFGWLGNAPKDQEYKGVSLSLTPSFDPLRKVAPAGLEEIDFEQRIAQWESLLGPSEEDDKADPVNDN